MDVALKNVCSRVQDAQTTNVLETEERRELSGGGPDRVLYKRRSGADNLSSGLLVG